MTNGGGGLQVVLTINPMTGAFGIAHPPGMDPATLLGILRTACDKVASDIVTAQVLAALGSQQRIIPPDDIPPHLRQKFGEGA